MERQIHIQHVVLSLQPGGLENGVVNIVNHLSPTHFRSSVCCLRQAGAFASRIQEERVAVHELGWRGGLNLSLPLRLAKLFRDTKTDVVHTRNSAAFLYGFLGAKIAGVKSIIHSEHGQTFDDSKLRFWTQGIFSRYTDAIFTVSDQLRLDISKHVHIPIGRLQVLYNGVDASQFLPIKNDRLREALGIECEKIIVGSVGRLVPVKNYDLLIRSLQLLVGKEICIVLIGDGPERGALEALAQSLKVAERVKFLGHRDDIAELVAGMDIFVLPSSSEGMSNTLIEAMAAGVAVVASNVGGTPEIVRDGVDGLLFESGNAVELQSCVERLVYDIELRNRLSASGRDRVVSQFSIDAMISRYERLYKATFAKPSNLSISKIQRSAVKLAVATNTLAPALGLRKSNPLILLYHGVSNLAILPGQLRNHDRKHLPLATFIQHLKTLKKWRRVISSTEMVEGLTVGEDMKNTIAITFDDGYENNVLHAAPVLSEFNMPATFFLTTGFVDTNMCAWTDRVEIMLDRTAMDSFSVPWLAQRLPLSSFDEKRVALNTIKAALKKLPHSKCLEAVAEIEDQLGITPENASGDYRFMTWDQARHLASAGFEIGAHSATHPILSKLPFEDAKQEILGSRDMVLSEVGHCCPIFAYPNGNQNDYTTEIMEFCRGHFRAALSTKRGHARANELFELNRLTPPEGAMASHIEWALLREK